MATLLPMQAAVGVVHHMPKTGAGTRTGGPARIEYFNLNGSKIPETKIIKSDCIILERIRVNGVETVRRVQPEEVD
jgi:hypothetical protein